MKKKFVEKEISMVDVHNNTLMVELGIRLSDYEVPDFSKTPKEKALLKKLRTKNDMKYSGKQAMNTLSHTCYAKLIINIPKHKGDTTNTISHKCYEYEIPSILRMYPNYTKYYYNGVTHFAV